MNCREFRNGMPEDSPDVRPEALRHAGECPACAERLRWHWKVSEGLRALGDETGRIKAPQRVETRLVAAFREHGGVAESQPRRQPGWWWMVAVAAMAAMAAAGVFLVLALRPDGPRPPAPPQRVLMATNQAVSGIASDVVPVLNELDADPEDDIAVVRLAVPRGTLLALGLPMTGGDEGEEPIQADFVLGQDGMVRGVRFLQ